MGGGGAKKNRVIGTSGNRVIGKAGDESTMSEMSVAEGVMRVPEARYSYYRRCHVFRRNGEQCKAPAENGEQICHAHAGQQATAVRRERERRAVLAEAVAQMRRKGRPEFEAKDLFMDFNGIQVTLAVMAQALIDGRIDCKTAGRLVVALQMASKLLWIIHRKGREGRKGNQISPEISADGRRLSKGIYHRGHRGAQREKDLTTNDTRSTPLSQAQVRSGQATEREGLPQIDLDERRLANGLLKMAATSAELPAIRGNTVAANQGEETRTAAEGAQDERNPRWVASAKMVEMGAIRRAERADIHAERANGPPGWARAA
jgi:hypothetical protein